jgi:hypothetical protein
MAIAPAPYVADALDLDEATAGDRCPIGAAMFAAVKDEASRR